MSRYVERDDVMDACPEGFKEILKEFIDNIERSVIEIKDNLEIDCADDLSKISKAVKLVENLSSELY